VIALAAEFLASTGKASSACSSCENSMSSYETFRDLSGL